MTDVIRILEGKRTKTVFIPFFVGRDFYCKWTQYSFFVLTNQFMYEFLFLWHVDVLSSIIWSDSSMYF